MPTYAYRCESCGHEFERFQSIKADPVKVCPQCHRAKTRRLIGTGAAILFKGSGFYATDYRSKTYADAAKSDGQRAPSPAAADSKAASSAGDKGAAGSGPPGGKSGTRSGGNGSAK
jgi:putative FmdB family regulatory protein